MPNIVGVQFKKSGKAYYFDPKDIEFQVGENVIVETARGIECGEIARFPERDELVRAKRALLLFFLGIDIDDVILVFLFRHDVSFLLVISFSSTTLSLRRELPGSKSSTLYHLRYRAGCRHALK